LEELLLLAMKDLEIRSMWTQCLASVHLIDTQGPKKEQSEYIFVYIGRFAHEWKFLMLW
jgi:hypothetical protein